MGATSSHAAALDPGYVDTALGTHCPVQEALAAFNSSLAIPLTADQVLSKRQHELTQLLDKHSWEQQLAAAPPVFQATLRSEAEPGARAFLATIPSGRTRMEPAAFCAELRHRLGVPDSATDAWCPKCDGVLHSHSYHAATCCAGGERTLRHHAVRDLLCTWTTRAGFQPVLPQQWMNTT